MIQAEPNKTKIKFKIVSHRRSENFPDKTELQITILDSEQQEDTRFIVPGKTYEGFTFEQAPNLTEGNTFMGEGEYLGGPGGGKILLSNLSPERK